MPKYSDGLIFCYIKTLEDFNKCEALLPKSRVANIMYSYDRQHHADNLVFYYVKENYIYGCCGFHELFSDNPEEESIEFTLKASFNTILGIIKNLKD
jgi:hypothetical protein